MFEIRKTYINNNEYTGKMVKTPSGCSFYCDIFTVIDTCINRISHYNVRCRSDNTWDTRNTRMYTG